MKITFTTLFCVLIANQLFAQFASSEPFFAAPSAIYAPQGFDDNDNVEIVFEGYFPDACHKVGPTSFQIDPETRSIYIEDTGYFFGVMICAQVVVYYPKVISLGHLDAGEYQVFFRHSRGNFVKQSELPIRIAKSEAPDDHLYAPVEKTLFIKSDGLKKNQLKLIGTYTNSCMKITEARVVMRNNSNVIDILPIAAMESEGCQDLAEGLPFEYMVNLGEIPSGRYLFHTRSLNGQSVNEIVTIK